MTTKLSVFRAFLVLTLAIGLCSYVMAGPRGGKHDRSRSGTGFSSSNHPVMLGKTAKDEYPDFFNKDNNPGIQASAFGRETSSKARMREHKSARGEVTSDCFNRTNTPDPRSFFSNNNNNMRLDPAPARSPVPTHRPEIVPARPDPLPSATPSQSVFPVPNTIKHHPLPTFSPWPSPFPALSPRPFHGGIFPPLPPLPSPHPWFPPPPYRGPPSYPVPSPIPTITPVDR